jgi:hypothetical protein
MLDFPIVNSIGQDFDFGGYGNRNPDSFNGYKITSPNSPLFSETQLKTDDVISISTAEYDGIPNKGFDNSGMLILDTNTIPFEKF